MLPGVLSCPVLPHLTHPTPGVPLLLSSLQGWGGGRNPSLQPVAAESLLTTLPQTSLASCQDCCQATASQGRRLPLEVQLRPAQQF